DFTGPFGPNWAVLLLPHLEQTNLYAQANPSSYPGVTIVPGTVPAYASVNNSWRSLRGVTVPVYQCPSDPNNQNPYNDPGPTAPPETGWARGNYGATAGYEDYDHVNGGNVYTTKAAGPLKGVKSSPVMAANYGARIVQISGGTSNTIMVAELRA